MHRLEPAMVAKAVIPYFLRSLMRVERERKGLSRTAVSKVARWSASTWGHLERDTRAILPHHWMNIAAVLKLEPDREARRLNSFIEKYQRIWLEEIPEEPGSFRVCRRALTSPKVIKSDDIVSVDLNSLRPSIFYEFSTYTAEPEELIVAAKALGFFAPRPSTPVKPPLPETDPTPSLAMDEIAIKSQNRRDRISMAISKISDNKLPLVELILLKFAAFSAADLDHAYKHFSLSLKGGDQR